MQHRGAHADERSRREQHRVAVRLATSSNSPTNVNPMPIANEYGCGRLSVNTPITGCSSDAVT